MKIDLLNDTSVQDQLDSASGENQSEPKINLLNDTVSSNTSQTDNSDPWKNFIETAQNVVTKRGLPHAVLPVLLGQAALESARGSASPGNNFFGIKGSGSAGSNNLGTQEYGNGGYYNENDNFAAYKSPEDSINAYLDLIMSYPGVPQAVLSNNPDSIIKAIETNGYATSPTYVQNIENTPEFQGGAQ